MPWDNNKRVVPGDWKSRKARALREHNRVCHICGHGDAEQVDHIINIASGGDHEPDNLRPVHGKPCPTCRRTCHQEKTQQEAAAARAANRAKLKHPEERHPGLR